MATAQSTAEVATAPAPVRGPERPRHWREKFDPNADFIFRRRLKLGVEGMPEFVEPGDAVPRGTFHAGRLAMWWRAGFIGIAPVQSNLGSKGAAKPGAPKQTKAVIGALRGGWFQVTIHPADGSPVVTRRIRGRAAVDSIVDAYDAVIVEQALEQEAVGAQPLSEVHAELEKHRKPPPESNHLRSARRAWTVNPSMSPAAALPEESEPDYEDPENASTST